MKKKRKRSGIKKGGVSGAEANDFRRGKLLLALGIMVFGLLLALACAYAEQWYDAKYPLNTFLYLPAARYSDFTDNLFIATLKNPYTDPNAPYLPFAWIFLRALSPLPIEISLLLCLYTGLAGLILILNWTLKEIVVGTWSRVFISFLFMGCSYPILFCVDRGNIEIVLGLLLAAALGLIWKRKYKASLFCLVPIIALKLYPALLLVLLLRRRKIGLVFLGLGLFAVLTLLSLALLSLAPVTAWTFYSRDAIYFADNYIYENHALEGSASLWNAYKLTLISSAQVGMIPPIDFSFDGSFIHVSYAVYSAIMALLALGLVFHTCVLEKEFLRCAIVLLLFLAVAAPSGGDYRLLYAGMALIALVLIKGKRHCDRLILVFLALLLVPKKEVILSYAGFTESGYRDVSLQVLLNPLLAVTALALVCWDGVNGSNLRWMKRQWEMVRVA